MGTLCSVKLFVGLAVILNVILKCLDDICMLIAETWILLLYVFLLSSGGCLK